MSNAIRESEREPAKEVFHRPEATKEIRITLTEKDREMIRQSVEDIKKWMSPKEERDGVRNIADGEKSKLEEHRKRFVKDDELTKAATLMIAQIGKQFLSEDEIQKAIKDFKGAGFFKGERLDSFHREGGRCMYDAIIIDWDASNEIGDPLLVHEIGHYLHFWVMRQNVDNDPILKTVYDYLKQFNYEDAVIVISAMYFMHDDTWEETFASALERDWLKSKGEQIDETKELYHKQYYANLLAELLTRNPKEFRKVMENPSYLIDSKYEVGDRVINSMAEHLGMEVPHVGIFDIMDHLTRKQQEENLKSDEP